jgi:signal transduction histidine kinase
VIHPDDLQFVLPENAAFVADNAIEYRIILPDHSIRNIWAQAGESVYDDNGNLKFLVGVAQDITERKKLEQELVEAKLLAEENDRLKSAFLANMSHEIRTPMNGILGFAELLKEPKLTGEEQLEYIDIINKSGTRMLNIINDIITISKVESGQMKVFVSETDINEQIDYIYTFFKQEIATKGMEFIAKKSLSVKECIVSTDREKIYAILTNLVKNAIKFSEKGTIEFGYDLVANKHPESLQFFVKDNGIGIPKDKQIEIFDRFIQADIGNARAFQGSGLGLSISKAFVEMLGGKIWVESEPGKGSTFYFTIQCTNEKKIN